MLNQPDCKVNRTTLFTLIFLFIGMAAFSQPVNDECNEAVPLPVNNDGSCTLTTIGTHEYATQSLLPCASTGYEALDVWFKFTATAATHKITVTPLYYRDKIFEVFSGTCGNLTSLACINSGGLNEADMTVLTNLTIGNTYYVRGR
jgi:hypothetical protein